MKKKSETMLFKETAISKMNDVGIKGLSNRELLYLSVDDDCNASIVAESILDVYHQSTTTDDLFNKLSTVDSATKDEIVKLLAMGEFVRRHQEVNKKAITEPADIYKLIAHLYKDEQEVFIVIGLNGANEPIYKKVVTTGLIDQTLVHPREVFADAVASRCSRIIIAHNHPTHRLTPSKEDIASTNRIRQAGALLGISLLDHLIFSDTDFYSMKDHNLL